MTSADVPQQLSLFGRHEDRAYISLAVVFLLLSLLSVLFVGWLDPGKSLLLDLLVATVFFNSMHGTLGLVGLLILPQGRKWLGSQLHPRRIIFVAILIVIAYWAVKGRSEAGLGVFISMVMLQQAHAIGQNRGLALLLSNQIRGRFGNMPEKDFQRAFRAERWLLSVLSVLIIGFGTLRGLFPNHLLNGQAALVGLGSGIILGLLFLTYWRSFGPYRKDKILPSLPLAMYPLTLFSPLAIPLNKCLHGTEYVMLCSKIYPQYRSTIHFSSKVLAILSILFIVVAICQLKFFPQSPLLANPMVRHSVLALVVFLEYTHYYVDSILFRRSPLGSADLVKAIT